MKKNFYTFVLIALASVFLVSCTSKTPYTNRSQMILMSESEELALGEQSYKEALKDSEVITNTKDSRRVKNIGQKIAQVANKNDYNWEFNLVKNDAANAFCLPGGKVVVFTGILKIAQNDDQLATVISHEIAHAIARHGAERVSMSKVKSGIGMIGSVVLGSMGSPYGNVFDQAYGISTQLGVMMPYGRMQESEADEIGIILMYKAGYNLNEAVNFWDNMSKDKKSVNEFFSTHPSGETRIKDIKEIIKRIEG